MEAIVKAIVDEKIGRDTSREIVCIEGYDVLGEEISSIRGLISQVLYGDATAIRQALAILGKNAPWITEEDIARGVIDLRSRTEEMRDAKRAREQLGQAL